MDIWMALLIFSYGMLVGALLIVRVAKREAHKLFDELLAKVAYRALAQAGALRQDMGDASTRKDEDAKNGLPCSDRHEVVVSTSPALTETTGQFMQRLGMDGQKWAEEMHKAFPQVPYDDLLGWCCNMIMAGYDEAERRAQSGKPPELPE